MSIRRKLYIAVILLFIVLAIGVIGYMSISGDSFVDALYMTVITISTVGFGLVHPLSQEGKIFTIFLIFLSVTLYGYIIKVITENIANGNFFEELKHNKMQKKIDSLKQHTIICGYGRNGQQALIKLQKYNQDCVIIERDKERAKALESKGFLIVDGDATEDSILEKAAIENAKNLIVALPSDADNLFVVLSAKQMNKNLHIISRASEESSYKKLKIAGADNVIMPDKLGGDHMASLVVTPDVIEFVDMLTVEGQYTANLKEIVVDDLPNSYISQSIIDLDLRRKTGCSIIGFISDKDEYIINPEATTQLVAGSKLIVLGRPEQIEKIQTLY
jgi:voltage-gated potassium channel